PRRPRAPCTAGIFWIELSNRVLRRHGEFGWGVEGGAGWVLEGLFPGGGASEQCGYVDGGERVGWDARQALATFGQERARAADVSVARVMEGDGELDEALETLAARVRLRTPNGFEDLVHLEEETGVPERHSLVERAIEGRLLAPCAVGAPGA